MARRTFGDTKAHQNVSSGFSEPYYKQVPTIRRKVFMETDPTKQLRLILVGGMIPLREHGVAYAWHDNGDGSGFYKTFPTACTRFNPETEEFEADRPCALCDYEESAKAAYPILVLVKNWMENPQLNPNPEKGPFAILELTAGLIAGIVNAQKTTQVEDITDPTCNYHLVISGARKGNKGPIDYSVNSVYHGDKMSVTMDWLKQQCDEREDWTMWDLEKYAKSKYQTPHQLITSLARNDYYESVSELEAVAMRYVNSGQFPHYWATDAEAKADVEVITKEDGTEENKQVGSSWEYTKTKVAEIFNKNGAGNGQASYENSSLASNAGATPPAPNQGAAPPPAPPAASGEPAAPPAPPAAPAAAAAPPTPPAAPAASEAPAESAAPPAPPAAPAASSAPPAPPTPPVGGLTPPTPPIPGK